MTASTQDTCWRSIGVQGNRSCAELARHAHCRNCPVHAAGAAHSLTRPVDAGYGDAWARELARPADTAILTDAAAMVFRAGAEWLAVPLALASSVAPSAAIHRLPHRGEGALLGVVAAGGKLLPAVSPAHLLGIADDAPAPSGRHAFARLLILMAPGAPAFALPVDEVHGVLRYARAALQPPAATVGRAPPLVAGVLAGAVDGAAGLLDVGLLDAALLMQALKESLR